MIARRTAAFHGILVRNPTEARTTDLDSRLTPDLGPTEIRRITEHLPNPRIQGARSITTPPRRSLGVALSKRFATSLWFSSLSAARPVATESEGWEGSKVYCHEFSHQHITISHFSRRG